MARNELAKNNKNAKREQLNETGRRQRTDRRKEEVPVATERRKVQRRRQIDPTTCERDYTEEEVEFMQALDQYKRESGRMFPTCSEILEVIRGLGYSKREAEDFAGREIESYQGQKDASNPDAIEVG